VLYQANEALRGHIHPHARTAVHHARWILDAERWTGILHEPRLNHLVHAHKALAQAMNIYYGTVHFVAPPLVLVWLWRRHPGDYRRWRDILAVTTVLSLACFAAFPLAPPRLTTAAHVRFEDTTPYGGLGPLDRGNFKDQNPYAAMPSLHLAWATWCTCAVAAACDGERRRWRWLTALYPVLTLVVVVGTANHWLLDAVGGWLVLLGAWWAVTHRHRPAPTRGTQDDAAQSGAPGTGR